MFNVAVVNIKDLIKYLVGLILAILLFVWLTRYFSAEKKAFIKSNKTIISTKIENYMKNSYIEALNETIPAMNEINNKEKDTNISKKEIKNTAIYERLLHAELVKYENIEDDGENTNNDEVANINESVQEDNLKESSTDVGTEIVTPNPIVANPTDTYGKVQIRNQTGYILSQDILTPNIEVNNKNIIVFHTHTCESYTPTEQNQYESSGSYRTTDLAYSVARVGDELTNYLNSYAFNVTHDKTFHDYPAYTGSYARSLKTVEGLKKNVEADVIIDLHRDAIGSNNDYAPTVRIGEDYAAQLMFVIGTDGGGLWHPNWQQNLKFAVKVQEKAEELYPGLFKPIIVRNSRYNQHVSKAATIIEVGATGNTLEQSLTSMKYLAKVLNEIVK